MHTDLRRLSLWLNDQHIITPYPWYRLCSCECSLHSCTTLRLSLHLDLHLLFLILAKRSWTWTELNTLFGWNFNQLQAAPLELDVCHDKKNHILQTTLSTAFKTIIINKIYRELFLQVPNYKWSHLSKVSILWYLTSGD